MTYFLYLTRWSEWYRSKGSLFLSCMYYAALSRAKLDPSVMIVMGGLLLLLCMLACFGHMANSFSDREIDKAAGKECPLTLIPTRTAKRWVATFGILGLLGCVILYHGRWDVLILLCAAFALAMFYSLPPLRLKERGILGLFTAAVAQRTLPAVIIFQVMRAWDWTALGVCILGTLIGLRAILWHQLLDKETDSVLGVRTFVVSRGAALSRGLLRNVIFPLEMAALFMVVAAMSRRFPLFTIAPLALMAWMAARVLLHQVKYMTTVKEFTRILAEFYEVILPLLLAVLLVERDIRFGLALLFTYLWLYGYRMTRTLKHLIRSSYLRPGKWRVARPIGPIT
jgi:1,4-dihydroxy-2-naphthoate octaprenyltransferase